MVNEFLKRITLPVDILKEIAIVDTPGTNTIIEKHQAITESFIPGSDLIVFVFEAKNPYRQSAWDFLNFIHADWKKKVIFVLQQKDLLDAADLQVNMNGVREQAEKKGLLNPMVFAVSAKQELDGNKEDSGFIQVRKYISDNVTGGKAPYLKLRNSLDTLDNIREMIGNGLQLRKDQFVLDKEFRADIVSSLDEQEVRSGKHVDMLIENILNAYDAVTGETQQELDSGLSFFPLLKRSFSAIFSKKESLKSWLLSVTKDLESNLNNDLRRRLDDGVGDVAESIHQMARIIQLKVQNSKTILSEDHEIFSDIAEKRHYIMQDLQNAFNTFLDKSENFNDRTLFPDQSNIGTNIAAGSGIALIGIILAGITTAVKKRKIMDTFRQEIAKGKSTLDKEISRNLKEYIHNLRKKIEDNYRRFDMMLINEEKQIATIEAKYLSVREKFDELNKDLEK